MEDSKFDKSTQEELNEEREILLNNRIKDGRENMETINENKSSRGNKFVTELGRTVTDIIVMTAISYVLFLVVEGIMKVSGYKIVDTYRIAFLFIIYIIISILYRSVFSISKSGKTVGEKIFK